MGRLLHKCFWCVLLCWLCFPSAVSASETPQDKEEVQKGVQEDLIHAMHLSDVDQVLSDIFPRERLSFTDTVTSIIKGDTELTLQLVGQFILDQLFYEFQYNRKTLVHIIILAILAAILTNFSTIFQNRQISEMSFYILYLLLITLCLNSFLVVAEGVAKGLSQLLTFIEILSPAYFLAVGIASGGSTAVVFYNIVLFLIYMIEVVILNFLMPLIHVYIMVEVINHLSLEDTLSKFSELLHLVIEWMLKAFLACVVGLNVVQGLIMPVVDSLKRMTVTRTAEAIPGIGDALGGMADLVIGTTVLVKNGIGVAGAVFCILICIVPAVQMILMTLSYKLIAAMVQPVSDKRIVGCISSMGDGYQLLLKVIITTGILFLLTIAVVTATTT